MASPKDGESPDPSLSTPKLRVDTSADAPGEGVSEVSNKVLTSSPGPTSTFDPQAKLTTGSLGSARTAARATAAAFQPDNVLAGRYRIVRFIARGGMGEVYEAEDLELKERVALKTIRGEIADDERAIERFRREIQMARKVTHRNVCRIFDLFRHTPAADGSGGPPEPVTFLTMELLSGETLAERIRKAGHLATGDAQPIVEQMTDALGAAHRVGIVHRDFKSGNVVLVPSPEDPGGMRAVITDFGLAYAESAASMTGSDDMVGTPAYMAPEQVEGGEITPATDVYALGVVMYEMVTGTWPFTGPTRLSVALKRLKEPAPSPRLKVPDLAASWEAVILRCLEKQPSMRFAAAADVARALAGEQVAKGKRVRDLRKIRRTAAAAAIAVVLLAGSIAGYRYLSSHKGAGTATAGAVVKARPSVAVFPMENVSGRDSDAGLSGDLTSVLAENLASGDQLRVVPLREVLQAAKEFNLAPGQEPSPQVLAQIKQRLNADYAVFGSYNALQSGSQVRVKVRMYDTAQGTSIPSPPEAKGKADDVFKLMESPSAQLRRELGAPALNQSEASGVLATLPSNPAAAKAYSQGRTTLYSKLDPLNAVPLFEQARTLEPDFPLTYAELGEAWSQLGYDAKAQDAAKTAYEKRASLSPRMQSVVEARYYELQRDWEKAITAYRNLWIKFPDELDYGLSLASVQTQGGKGKEALETLQEIRKGNPKAADDPRMDLAEANAADSMGDYKSEQAAANRAAAAAKRIGSPMLQAQANIMECMALLNLGDPAKAVPLCQTARDINQNLGNRAGVAWAVNNLANALAREGDFNGAKQRYEEALKITREVGDKLDMSGALNNYANMVLQQGNAAAAKALYEQSSQVARERGSRQEETRALGNMANCMYMLGDRAGAERAWEQALVSAREIHDRDMEANLLGNLGSVRFDRGDLAAASEDYGNALAIRQATGQRSETAALMLSMGDVALARGQLAEARKQYQQAQAIEKELGEKNNLLQSSLALGEVALAEGKPGEAEQQARQTAAEFKAGGDTSNEVGARLLLVRALLAQGKVQDAKPEVDQISALVRKIQDPGVRLNATLGRVRYLLASGNSAEALHDVNGALSDATKMGLTAAQLEARLLQAQASRASGKAAAATTMFDLLQKDAAAHGYQLIAQKAASALKP